MNTDPVADMLTRIRNAAKARMERVDIPSSNLKINIAKVLKEEGFVNDYRVISKNKGPGDLIEISLKYDNIGDPVIESIQRVSKPGLRKYLAAKDIPKVRNGLGVMILTTSKGVMTDKSARKDNIGGEPLCSVW